MVVAALLAGSITLWLANDVATRELPDNIASTIKIPPTALQKSERHLGEDLVVNVSFEFGRNSAQLPSR